MGERAEPCPGVYDQCVADTAGPERALGHAPSLSVLVVDDHTAFADAMALAIDYQPDLCCVGAVHTGKDALERVEAEHPDVLLLDIALPDLSGMEVTARVKATTPGTRVLLITGTTTPEALARAAEVGADGFLPKEVPITRVLEAIREPSDSMFADERTLALILQRGAQSSPARPGPVLTDREAEVLDLLADGQAVKAIARQLDISLYTCRGYVQQILRKLDVHSQLAAVVKAAGLGLVRRP